MLSALRFSTRLLSPGFADFGHVAVAEPRPQAVGAGEQHVARFEFLAVRDAHVRHRRVAADAALDEIAHRVILGLFFGDGAFLDQHLDMAVVAGARQNLALAHLVDTAVADMRPECAAFLHEADRAGRPRPEVHGDVSADPTTSSWAFDSAM